MRKEIYIFAALLIFTFVGLATAHPLGNFTVNHYSRIEVEKSQVKLRAVLDLAEIPTFQESQKIDTNKDGALSEEELNAYAENLTPEYIANLQLSVDDSPIVLRSTAKNISLPPGSGNLPTLRIEWDLIGDLPGLDAKAVHQLKFENKNNAERIGWNEIVVERVGGISVFNSTAFGSGITDELKSYPGENLNAPLAERKAEFSFTSSILAADVKPLQNRDGHISAPVEKDKFAELIAVPEVTPSIILFGLLLAFGFGAMHALSPGHGKTVVGAYLIGSRGTVKHAIFLGAIVTITHTLGVFALGLLTLFASNYILPETLMPFLSFVSGLLVLFIGLTLFKDRLFTVLGYKTDVHHHHDHIHPHSEHDHSHNDDDHTHNHTHDGLAHTHGGSTHTHLPPENITWRSLLALGISGGLLPCPSALVLMLSAINLNRIGYGIVLTLVFSFGLAATLTAVGLAFLYTGKFFDNPKLSSNRIIKALPVFSAFVIACVGAVICYNSLV
ncbi:MAG: nickel/cobalt transporter [Pyrinomonadaceae bacterium]